MKHYFDYKLEDGGIAVQFCNTLSIEEREMHSYHEILYCENASTVFYTENEKTTLCGKQLLIIPKGKYHMFDVGVAEEFTRLKIFISDEVINKLPVCIFSSEIRIVTEFGSVVESLIDKVCELMRRVSDERDKFYVFCAVKMLIAELNLSNIKNYATDKIDKNGSEIIRMTVLYISQNLSEDLSVNALSKIANVSPSYLTHEFKKTVGIQLHKYIVQKRMVHAREMLDRGEKPTKIYINCGYNDYSSFYKAYLNYFNTPPSEKK